ncbi:MAG: hypothetical protein OHK93_004918 [Ramalina farinacea]|uniref:DUF3669 domain-containing protein n=1 Tax=Ramalina farinacea TaxID=258253 RepID=A0AA43QV03_9LECA|nr:hypothetical protein [Ramalina farinacea]
MNQLLSLQNSIRLNCQMTGHFELLKLSDITEERQTSVSRAAGPIKEIPYNAITFLNRALSPTSVISISSSLAKRYQTVLGANSNNGISAQQYYSIGSGQCGRVFAYADDPWVLKRPNSSPDPLWNDYIMHSKLRNAATKHPNIAALCAIIPKVQCYISNSNKPWWDINLAKFPPDYRSPSDLLVTEYIQPLSAPIRFALIDLFCPPEMQETQMQSPGYRDCLARIYLGANASGRTNRFFSLRNFKLFHDRLQRLGLDLDALVGKMASSMALMHFGAKIDGRDVEFVLGSKVEATEKISLEELERMAPCTDTLHPTAIVEPGPWHYCRRRVEMFVLDFNQCRSIEMNKEGMETAAEAFVINDPYCPRPHHADEGIRNLWVYFCQVYREMAVEVGGPELGRETIDELVGWFLESIDARVRARKSREVGTE